MSSEEIKLQTESDLPVLSMNLNHDDELKPIYLDDEIAEPVRVGLADRLLKMADNNNFDPYKVNFSERQENDRAAALIGYRTALTNPAQLAILMSVYGKPDRPQAISDQLQTFADSQFGRHFIESGALNRAGIYTEISENRG